MKPIICDGMAMMPFIVVNVSIFKRIYCKQAHMISISLENKYGIYGREL